DRPCLDCVFQFRKLASTPTPEPEDLRLKIPIRRQEFVRWDAGTVRTAATISSLLQTPSQPERAQRIGRQDPRRQTRETPTCQERRGFAESSGGANVCCGLACAILAEASADCHLPASVPRRKDKSAYSKASQPGLDAGSVVHQLWPCADKPFRKTRQPPGGA